MCRHGVISTSQSDSLLLIRVNNRMSIIHRWESTMLPSVVISVHAVVFECWPIFDAGDQQGCDFNSPEFDGIRNNRQQKSHFCGVALMNNLNELRSV